MALRNAVQKWSQFVASDTQTCAKRTRQRQAVFFGASIVLEKYIHYLQGQVQISREYAGDVMLPVSLLLPKASPYKEPLNYAVIRMVETGLMEEIKGRYWKRTLPQPSTLDAVGEWQQLHFNVSTLPFIILVAGLGISSVVFLCEMSRGIAKKRRKRAASM
ncbi:hypothetical protein HPB52_017262 [Rhipicephalus sanguineus]|uniref:Ionotropic receptor n=1 Tax=Rhipicephalus sanguineus TaxID=34632 RepID=A0A9D4PHD7_RHISA|nr:hypothetical protein HPB52_017262 [Rhipicephalus sanguineus]